MGEYIEQGSWLDNAEMDGLLSMSSPFNFGSTTGLATPPEEPGDFIQRLANQSQVLACLRWLGEFQVLALIPLRSSISAIEVAELASVEVMQLLRVVRMTATAGFLCEPQNGQLAHTALSARFVTDLSFFDAIMFLAENAAPTALQMATVTERQARRKDSTESAHMVAFNTSRTFNSACQEEPRLQRRYNAYVRYIAAASSGFVELLLQLNWRALGTALIVDTNAQDFDVPMALSQCNPSLQFIIQSTAPQRLDDPKGQFSSQTRASGTLQTIEDATVYILRLREVSTLQDQLVSELHAHMHVLRGNRSATLIVEVPFVPEPGSVNPGVEATARLWDLSRSQLLNESDSEIADIENMINSVQDGNGKLVVVNKLRSRSTTMLAIGIRYEYNLSGLYSGKPVLV